MSEPKVIHISQSLIKALDEEKGRCPDKARAIYIDGMDSKPSFAMRRGLFFETIAFGATDSGEQVFMDPKKTGGQSAEEIRVRKQAHRLKTEIRSQFQMDWHEPRPHILVDLKTNSTVFKYVLRARIDMITSIMDKTKEGIAASPAGDGFIPRVIVDFKTTDSILSNFPVEFAWGMPHLMDHTQAKFYSWVYKLKYGMLVPFYYIVMDTSTDMDYKIVRKLIGGVDLQEIKETVRRTIATVEQFSQEGWPLVASHDNCRGCPLSDGCPAYRQGKDIQVV